MEPITHNRPHITLAENRKKTTHVNDILRKIHRQNGECYPLAEYVQSVWQRGKVIVLPVTVSLTIGRLKAY
jgi:hypothetical protein